MVGQSWGSGREAGSKEPPVVSGASQVLVWLLGWKADAARRPLFFGARLGLIAKADHFQIVPDPKHLCGDNCKDPRVAAFVSKRKRGARGNDGAARIPARRSRCQFNLACWLCSGASSVPTFPKPAARVYMAKLDAGAA